MQIFIIGGGLIFLFCAYFLSRQEILISKNWNKITGIVTKVEHTNMRIDKRSYSTKIVTIQYSVLGRCYKFTHQGESSWNPWKKGNPTNIFVDPNNPKKAHVSSPPLLIGGIFLSISMICFFLASKFWTPLKFSIDNKMLIIGLIASIFFFLKFNSVFSFFSIASPFIFSLDSISENAEEIEC